MGTFGNHLVLDTSYTVVNDATVTRINYTALWREQDPKQQLTVVKRFVAEKFKANRDNFILSSFSIGNSYVTLIVEHFK